MLTRRKLLAGSLLLGPASAVSGRAAELGNSGVSYRFESEPSQPLAAYGMPTSDPKLSLRASGAVYLLSVNGGHGGASLGLASSSDGGDSFGHPVRISAKDARVSSHGENSPTFAFGVGTQCHALWEERAGEGLETALLFATSRDFGRTWAPPVVVTDKAEPSTNAFSSFTVAPNGHIYTVWLDGRDRAKGAPGTSSVYLAKSTDGGKSFPKNVPVAHGVCPCCRPVAAADVKGTVHVVWRQVFPGSIRDMAIATSADGGATFGEPARVASDMWKIDGCPHAGASMALQGSRLWVSWYSDGDGEKAGVRVAWSDDGAKTFQKPLMVSKAILDANRPNLTLADDGRVLVVFQGRDPRAEDGWAPSGAYLVEIAADGSVIGPFAIPGHRKSVSYPVVAGGTLGRVIVAWTEPDEKGQPQVRLSRGRRVEAAAAGNGKKS